MEPKKIFNVITPKKTKKTPKKKTNEVKEEKIKKDDNNVQKIISPKKKKNKNQQSVSSMKIAKDLQSNTIKYYKNLLLEKDEKILLLMKEKREAVKARKRMKKSMKAEKERSSVLQTHLINENEKLKKQLQKLGAGGKRWKDQKKKKNREIGLLVEYIESIEKYVDVKRRKFIEIGLFDKVHKIIESKKSKFRPGSGHRRIIRTPIVHNKTFSSDLSRKRAKTVIY